MLGPMKLMIAAEFESTGADEMSLFQRLSDGNGTNPLRLPPCPAVIALHAEGGGGGPPPPLVEVTCKVSELEVALPGFGFITLTAKLPAEVALPVAVSCVEEIKVVESAEPESITCAPVTKLLPVTAIEKLPVEIEAGTMPLRTGIGFSSVTLLLPEALESAALTARTVTVLGFGNAAGAVYMPEALIVPVDATPPATPFTCHVTEEFEEPLTAAVKDCVAPARTLADFGETETVTAGGGVPGPPPPIVELLTVPVHAASKKTAERAMKRERRRMTSGSQAGRADLRR